VFCPGAIVLPAEVKLDTYYSQDKPFCLKSPPCGRICYQSRHRAQCSLRARLWQKRSDAGKWQNMRSGASRQVQAIKRSIVIVVIMATSGGVCSGRCRRLCRQAFPERSLGLEWYSFGSRIRIVQESPRMAPVCCRTYRTVKAWSHRHFVDVVWRWARARHVATRLWWLPG